MDRFAKIAEDGIIIANEGLIVPKPIEKENNHFSIMSDTTEVFTPLKRLETEEELRDALLEERRRILPFIENYAPKTENLRQTLVFDQALWRIQSEVDKKNFRQVLDGQGDWEIVTIPHYGAPVGRAVTFYRMTFDLSEDMLLKEALFVCFKGVDYKASIYINDRFVGFHEGFFEPFEFQITEFIKEKCNSMVVMVENDKVHSQGGEKIYAATGPGFDDSQVGWHHCPAGMGIYQDVYIEGRAEMYISDLFVRPMENLKDAWCWTEISGSHLMNQKCKLMISVYGQNFKETIIENLMYEPSTKLEVGLGDSLTEAKTKAEGVYHKSKPLYIGSGKNLFKIPIHIPDAKKWEPDQPWLYQVQVRLLNENESIVDCMSSQFGMRTFTMDTEGSPKGGFALNGQPIRLRGANTMGHEQQCIIKKDFDQLIDDILLAKLCNMNFLRITQRPIQSEMYDFCDRLGLMIQTDLPLFGVLSREKFCEGIKQAEAMERLIRNHPCCILVTYINEPFPNAGNEPHRCVERNELEDFFIAAGVVVRLQNPDRVIKPIDGDYNPPEKTGLPDNHCYPCWYNGHGIDMGRLYHGYWMHVKPDWYYGCGEFGAEGLDPVSVMRKYYPEEWLPQTKGDEKEWSPESIIGAQTGKFHYFFYETPKTLSSWVEESQRHQAWATKIMTEAFRRDSRMNTFAIHLFIDAFPSGWMKTIMDVERRPKKAYFAYRDALAPLLVSLRSDRSTYWEGEEASVECFICNDKNQTMDNYYIRYYVRCEDINLFSGRRNAEIPECSSKFQGYINFPIPKGIRDRAELEVYAGLFDEHDRLIQDSSMNFTIYEEKERKDKPALTILNSTGKAARLAQQMKADYQKELRKDSTVIIIDCYEDYIINKEAIDKITLEGARLIFLELTAGSYLIADTVIEVNPCPMLPVHFAAVNHDNMRMEEYQSNDFRWWYDEEIKYVTPLDDFIFISDDFDTMLSGVFVDDRDHWNPANITGIKSFGKGQVIVNLIKLAGRVETNPIAHRFVQNLLWE